MSKILYGAAQLALDAMPFLNGAMGLVIVGYIFHRLLCCSGQYNRAERAGMGLVAGGMILATPALWMQGTPFDSWSFNVGRLGIVIYIISGGMRRDRHARRNVAASADAARYLERKGKL